ncbi:uncharacterized protein LOC134530230 [Bacillus rossius redtenbacheri]|uniref:uncharacterized protein LOC134530230 n=1 Tax=Bacillus rossius redtenbacheri TaxID=93214 RepID=UPI002FDD91D0
MFKPALGNAGRSSKSRVHTATMKTVIAAATLCLVSQVVAYNGTLDVYKYAQTLVSDAKNLSLWPVYPSQISVTIGVTPATYTNISEGTLVTQDDYISLDNASYVLDSHGKALAVIVDFYILSHKVNYTYDILYSETDEAVSGTAVVSVDGYLVSGVITFIGGSTPVGVRFFANDEGNVTVTTNSSSLAESLVKAHWDETGQGKLQEAYVLNMQSAVFSVDITQYFN